VDINRLITETRRKCLQLHGFEISNLADMLRNNVVAGTIGTYRGEERCTEGFGGEPEREGLLGRQV
jgi:hypothetical protein